MQTTHCLNCEAPLTEKAKFCAHCGQTAHLHRLSIGHIIHDGLHFFLHADKSIFILVKKLATQSGKVAREFVEGKRKKYFPPLNFYLIVSGLLVLSMSTFHVFEKGAAANNQQLEAMVASIPDPAAKAKAKVKIYTIMQRQSNAMYVLKKYSNVLGMCAIPLLSLLIYLFYCRGRYNYAEHLIANLYSGGFMAVFFSLLVLPLMALIDNTWVSSVATGVYFLADLVYRSHYYYKFMNRPGPVAALKAVGVILLVQLFWFALVMTLMFWYIRSGMSGLFA